MYGVPWAIENRVHLTFNDEIMAWPWSAHAPQFRQYVQRFGKTYARPEGPLTLRIKVLGIRPRSHLTAKGEVKKTAPMFPSLDLRKYAEGVIKAGHGILWDRSQFHCIYSECEYGATVGMQVTVTVAEKVA